jgi:hypothetical protein
MELLEAYGNRVPTLTLLSRHASHAVVTYFLLDGFVDGAILNQERRRRRYWEDMKHF